MGSKHISKVTGPSNRCWSSPKTRTLREKTSGIIYCYQCAAIDCGEEYIGETSRTPGGEVQGTPKGALPHPSAQSTYRTPAQQGQLQYNRQGGAGHHKIN